MTEEHLTDAPTGCTTVGRAVSVVMQRFQLNADRAFELLTRVSQLHDLTAETTAHHILDEVSNAPAQALAEQASPYIGLLARLEVELHRSESAALAAPPRVISVLVVDRHPFLRAAVSALLRGAEGIECVGHCADGKEAEQLVATLLPDVVLIDIRAPNCGIETARRLLAERPSTRVLIHTAWVQPTDLELAAQAGAVGFVIKGAGPDALVNAIHVSAAQAPAKKALTTDADHGRQAGWCEGLTGDIHGQPSRRPTG